MFGFLKEKLKGALSAFSKKAEEEAPEEIIEAPVEKKAPKKEAVKKEEKKEQPKKEAPKKEEKKAAPKKEPPKREPPKKEEKKESPKKEEKREAPKKEEKKEHHPKEHPTLKSEPIKKEAPAEEPVVEAPKKSGFFSRIFGFGKKEEEKPEEKEAEKVDEKEAAEKKESKPSEPQTEEEPPTLEIEEEPKLELGEEEVEEEPAHEAKEEVEEEAAQEEAEIQAEEEEKAGEEETAEAEIEEEAPEEEAEEELEQEEGEEEASEETEEEEVEEEEAPKEKPTPKREKEPESGIVEEATGFFSRLTQKIATKKITKEQFEELFFDLEMALLENNVAVEVIEKIKVDLETQVVDKPIRRGQVEDTILAVLKESIKGLFITNDIDFITKAKSKKPYVICLFGINGSGKTTTIAKIAKLLQNNGMEPVIAAADTFRAAAIDQLEEHGDKLGVKVVKHDYGSDAAAVAFDAIKHAESKGKDVVLIDTAGRMHSNANLMDEMKKIIRVSKPDLKLFIGESIAGNDCVEQAKAFNDAVGIDGIILSKADVDEKGGAALSVSYVTGKPILFIGTGQEYKDLKPFSPAVVMESLGL